MKALNALVVDDEEDICDFLKEKLEELGLQVESATSGEEALEHIEKTRFELFVVDLKLSTSITGLVIIKAARNKYPEAMIAALTGYIDVGLRQEAERLGVNDFLTKPDDMLPHEFVTRMKGLLSKGGYS